MTRPRRIRRAKQRQIVLVARLDAQITVDNNGINRRVTVAKNAHETQAADTRETVA